MVIREPVLIVRGVVSRREDTFNIVAQDVQSVEMLEQNLPKAKDWQ